MKVTAQQLVDGGVTDMATATQWVNSLNTAMAEFNINTPQRVAMFLSQISHESGGFKHLRENLNYSAARITQVWPRISLANATAAVAKGVNGIAELIYGGRKDLGNTEVGDGQKFCGRGCIQLTGKFNYLAYSAFIKDESVITNPELLTQPEHAAKSAAWFFATHRINDLADAGDVLAATKRINGGTTGLAERTAIYNKILKVLAHG